MSARRAKKAKRQKLEKQAARPFVESMPELVKADADLVADGYTLVQHLFIRVNRRTLKANVEVRWKKPEPEQGPKAYRTMSHYFTIDLRRVMEKKNEAAAP